MDSGQHAEPRKPGIFRTFVNLLVAVAFIFGLSWALRTFVFQPYEIPSGSMETTIMTGDMVFSEKVSYYMRDPEPGDIVTFQDPEIPGRVLIKRCIAVGGQTVDLQDGKVVVDGVVQDEPYTRGLPSEPLTPALGTTITYPYTVPEGHLWMMGDNRTNSQDSRYFGAIDESTVTGRGMLIYWPLNNIGLLG
ncbi:MULTISPECIES: signal peptidase I [Gordonibacter]|uniref:Signal peptidase I n=1 Tax=Gordonibacter faecis TaxID=3047475 RepID=A0ABT7DPY9_9ACTN|nr:MULTISPECIES: signal peptidase I [unclassified Gordonibacter]MDJ1651606.1 signal peptidase I [Gordonibacter sp. KGMB12511]HIW77028.1 signal peptidase I [Candidatus Gordonibacter avicola]